MRSVLIEAYLTEHFDTRDLLIAWGQWSRNSHSYQGWRCYGAVWGLGDEGTEDAVCIHLEEEELEYIDKVLCIMRHTEPDAFEIILMKYHRRWKNKRIAKERKERYQDYLRSAKNALAIFHNTLVHTWQKDYGYNDEWSKERETFVTKLKKSK